MEKGAKGAYTIIGEGAEFEGSLIVPHDVRIDGRLKGKLETTESLTIGSSGNVEADIKARNALVGGKVTGNLIVEERVELEANSALIGDLKTTDLVIGEGAVFHGNCSMEGKKGLKV
jgi:cytoskeletal protein CcmA (bactofilin family)